MYIFLILGPMYIKQEAHLVNILHEIQSFKVMWTKVAFCSHTLSIFGATWDALHTKSG